MNLRKRPTKVAATIDSEPKQPEPRLPEQRQLRQRQTKPRQQDKAINQKKRKSMDPTEMLREKLHEVINRPSLPFYDDVIRYVEQFHAKHPNVTFEAIDSISKLNSFVFICGIKIIGIMNILLY